MFREGRYLEVIKVSDHCLATAIVSVKEKMVEIDKKKISTNKWLNLVDWAELYKILEKAIVRNSKASREKSNYKSVERRKTTSRLDIIYTFESPENPMDVTSLPTIKVKVSPARRKPRSAAVSDKIAVLNKLQEKENADKIVATYDSPEMKVQRLMEGIDEESCPEEYVPSELPNQTKVSTNLKYVASRKSILKRMKQSDNSNEYTPTSATGKNPSDTHTETTYIPNPISSLKKPKLETYEPLGIADLPPSLSQAYVPSSKGSSTAIEEYEPDFPSKTMKFDTSYVPSSKKQMGARTTITGMKKKIHGNETKNQRRSTGSKKSRVIVKT